MHDEGILLPYPYVALDFGGIATRERLRTPRRPSAGACPGLNRGREPRASAAGSVLAVRTDETWAVYLRH